MTPPRWRDYALLTCALTLLAIALTYPQIGVLTTHVGAHYDALFGIWRLAWVAHQLPRDPLHLFDANIFHPELNALAYSDPVLFEGLLAAPLFWLGMEAVAAYNLVVLVSFVAAGLAMYGWLRYRGVSGLPSWLGAFAFAFPQYAFAHLPQIELLWTCWIPLAFWALERTFDEPRLENGLRLGLVVAMQVWSSLYYAVFLVSALGLVAVLLLAGTKVERWRALLMPGIAGIALAVLLCLPYARPYAETREVRQQRTGEAARWSASPENYLSTNGNSWLYQRPPRQLTTLEGVLFPGFLTVGLAIVGAARARDRRTWPYAVLGLAAFDLTLGVHGVMFEPLQQLVPVFASVRVPARFYVLVAAVLALLAAIGAAGALRGRHRSARHLVGALLLAAVLLEYVSVPLPLQPAPEWPTHIYTWLRDQPRGVTVEWPLPRAHSLGQTRVPDYMYYSTRHWQPLAVGYSGIFPEPFFAMIEEMASFPSPQSLAYLRRRSVRYLILHSQPNPKAYVDAAIWLGQRLDVRLLRVDRTTSEEVAVYQVLPRD